MLKIVLKILNVMIVIIGCLAIYLYIDENNFLDQTISYYIKEHSVIITNEYTNKTKNNYYKIINNFNPKNRDDLLNIFYTVIASDNSPFTFYCPSNYVSCINDIKNIISDSSLLSRVNNFVHPYNAYKMIKTSYTNLGKITINITKQYTDDKIKLINDKIDELYPILVSNNKSVTENIRSIHDYIINHVKYDTPYTNGDLSHEANTAYGPLFEGYAICSGYTDLMSIFLNKMGIINHKISNNNHIWNAIYLDGKWLHLDLTADDPVASNNRNYLSHDYFLVSTDKLKEQDKKNNVDMHLFNEEFYLK